MMPNSIDLMDATVSEYISFCHPTWVLDVGSGSGKMGRLARSAAKGAVVHGIEVWADYLQIFSNEYAAFYSKVTNADFLDWSKDPGWESDLVIFGDVLEHFRYSRAIDAVHEAIYHAKHVIAVWPQVCVQGAHAGNVLEAHRCRLSLADFASSFDVLRYDKKDDKGYVKHAILLKGAR